MTSKMTLTTEDCGIKSELIPNTDDRLRESCSRFDFQDGAVWNNQVVSGPWLFEHLKEQMILHNGLGLAAPQIGIMKNVFILGNPREPETIIPVFNPVITSYSDETQVEEEGCLSFPGLFVKVRRALSIRVRYGNQYGVVDTINLGGLTARIFQHEYGHLHGLLYTRLAHPMHLEQARMQQKKMNRMRKEQMRRSVD